MPSYLQRNNHKHVLFCLYYVMYIIPLLVFNVFLESSSASAVHGRRMREEKFIGVILTPPPHLHTSTSLFALCLHLRQELLGSAIESGELHSRPEKI